MCALGWRDGAFAWTGSFLREEGALLFVQLVGGWIGHGGSRRSGCNPGDNGAHPVKTVQWCLCPVCRVVDGTHAGLCVFVKCKVFEHRCSGVQSGLSREGTQEVRGIAGVGCGDLVESLAQVVRRESKILVGEEGSNLFGKAMEDQRKGKTFLAGEGVNVRRLAGEGRVV